MAFRVTKTGEWNKVRRLAVKFPKEVQMVNKKTLMKVGLKAEGIAVKHLRDQDLGWQPLNEEYRKYKISKGGSEKTLIDTSTYLQAITSRVKRMTALVGVFRGEVKYDEKGEEDVVNIAAIHEFGSKSQNIPARPLWRPTLAEMKQWLKKDNIFAREVKEYFNKKYGL